MKFLNLAVSVRQSVLQKKTLRRVYAWYAPLASPVGPCKHRQRVVVFVMVSSRRHPYDFECPVVLLADEKLMHRGLDT